jgi:hypothetical protein
VRVSIGHLVFRGQLSHCLFCITQIFLELFYIPLIEKRKGIGVISIKNRLNKLLILFGVFWWI